MQQYTSMSYRRVIQTWIATIVLAMILPGCTMHSAEIDARDGYFASRTFKASGQNERVRYLVMHYTVLDDSDALKRLTGNEVSAHYLVPKKLESRQGKPVILQLVDEDKRAWHAGVSSWNGRVNLNDTAIGIEIVNPGYTEDMLGGRTWYPYSAEQLVAVSLLAKDLIRRYQIAPENVLGHSDIAPLRKQDPGKLFPWTYFAQNGIGAWPDGVRVIKYLAGRAPNAPANVSVIQALLKQYGYDRIPQSGILDKDTRDTIGAFQMHFRPSDISGNADAETEAIARALVEKYR